MIKLNILSVVYGALIILYISEDMFVLSLYVFISINYNKL
jgi:hypothetical protein